MADGALVAALADEGDHLAGADLQADVGDGDQLAAAEGADPVGLETPQGAYQLAFQQATWWSGATSVNGGCGVLSKASGQRSRTGSPRAGRAATGSGCRPAGGL